MGFTRWSCSTWHLGHFRLFTVDKCHSHKCNFAITNRSIYSGTKGGSPLTAFHICARELLPSTWPWVWMYSKLTLAGIRVQLGWSSWARIQGAPLEGALTDEKHHIWITISHMRKECTVSRVILQTSGSLWCCQSPSNGNCQWKSPHIHSYIHLCPGQDQMGSLYLNTSVARGSELHGHVWGG